jgi:hypothetical protein
MTNKSAPVYRNIETTQTVMGLSFPGQFLVLLGVIYAAIFLLPGGKAALVTIGAYVGIRVASHGRPPLFFQHFIFWKMRQALTQGWLSAAARSRQKRFPFARTDWRDVRPMGPPVQLGELPAPAQAARSARARDESTQRTEVLVARVARHPLQRVLPAFVRRALAKRPRRPATR